MNLINIIFQSRANTTRADQLFPSRDVLSLSCYITLYISVCTRKQKFEAFPDIKMSRIPVSHARACASLHSQEYCSELHAFRIARAGKLLPTTIKMILLENPDVTVYENQFSMFYLYLL